MAAIRFNQITLQRRSFGGALKVTVIVEGNQIGCPRLKSGTRLFEFISH